MAALGAPRISLNANFLLRAIPFSALFWLHRRLLAMRRLPYSYISQDGNYAQPGLTICSLPAIAA